MKCFFITKKTSIFAKNFIYTMDWESKIKEFEQYLKLEKGLSKNSVEAYIADLHKLTQFLIDNENNVQPEDVTLSHLIKMLDFEREKGINPRTQARIISAIKSFFKYMLIEEKIEKDPSSLLEAPKIGRKLPDTLTINEIEAFIEAIDTKKPEGQRNKAIIETLYAGGLRVSELTNLKISNLYFESGYVKIEGKGNKERLAPIGKKAIKEINLYLSQYRRTLKINKSDEDILFLNRRGKKLTREMIFTIIKNTMKLVNIHKNVSPHTFRHSFATHLIDGGANLKSVQDMLGHESIITTEIYTHLDKEYLKNTITQFHPRS